MAVRQEARGHCDLIVYTGTWGVLHLTDNNNESQPIYLAYDKENNGLLPVPKYFWKVVHNPVDNTAIALITINNPHMTLVKKEDIFCPDVCNQVLWIYWDVSNIRNGYTFCCAVRDFSRVVLYSPQLNVPLFGGVPFSLVMEPSFNYLADLLANLMASAVALFAILFPIYSCLAGFSLL